jgi:fibronectin-binding autotransporter adhesin
LEVGNSPSIGSGPLILNNGGGIELNGFSESFASLNGSDGVIDYVSATANDLTLTIGSGNVNATYGGTIQNVYGPIVLSMTGSAVQTLTGSNSYTGGTILNSGTLAINSDQAIGFAVGGIDFNGGTLQFDNCASTLALSGTNVSLGAAAGAGSTLVGSITDNGTPTNLTYVGPGTLILAGSNSYSGATNVNAGTMQITTPGSIPATTTLTIGSATSTGAVQLATSGGAFTLSGLTINVGSSLDLANNSLTINYGSSDPIAAIVSYLSAGYAAGWASGQIVSSAVASLNASQKALLYDIGYADGADGLTSLPSGEIEIVPTIAGDAKLQGNVVFGDFQLLAQYFGQSGTWDEGNFSYGATIDFGDFQMLAQDFGSTSGGLTPQEITALQNFATQFGDALTPNPDGVGFSLVSVPEPASVSLLAGGVGLLARRRRRSPNR